MYSLNNIFLNLPKRYIYFMGLSPNVCISDEISLNFLLIFWVGFVVIWSKQFLKLGFGAQVHYQTRWGWTKSMVREQETHAGSSGLLDIFGGGCFERTSGHSGEVAEKYSTWSKNSAENGKPLGIIFQDHWARSGNSGTRK